MPNFMDLLMLNQAAQAQGGQPISIGEATPQMQFEPVLQMMGTNAQAPSFPTNPMKLIQATKTISMRPPSKVDQLQQELLAQQTESLKQQKEGIKQWEKQAGGLQGTNPWIAALAAGSDILGGTNMLQGVMGQQQAQENEKKALAKDIQSAKNALTGRETDILKAQLAAETAKEKSASDEEKWRMMFGLQKEKVAKGPELKDWQVQSATYGKRIAQAEDVFNKLTTEGFNRANAQTGAESALMRGPLAQLKGDQLKQQEQAERNFLTATLRKESGAAISSSEFDVGEKQYFPRAGDSPEVLAQKAANRRQVMEGMRLGAGPAWDTIATIPGAPTPSSTGKPSTVTQGGHTYILNPQTGEYE